MKKTDLVRFRCTPEERKLIEDLARNDARTLSDFLLNLVYQEQNKRIKSVTSIDEFEDDIFSFEYIDDMNREYQEKEKERCKRLGITYDPFSQHGSKKEWEKFYESQVNE